MPSELVLLFDRPVARATRDDIWDAPGVSMVPAVDGQWRWMNAQIAYFEPADGWPEATDFELAVDEGIEAMDGAGIAERYAFEFATSAPTLRRVYPKRSDVADFNAPVIAEGSGALSDQTADSIVVRADGEVLPMEVATDDERDHALSQLGLEDEFDPEQFLVLLPTAAYPRGASVQVSLDGPIYSSQGSRTQTQRKGTSFQVRHEFAVEEIRCGRSDACRPQSGVSIDLSHPVDAEDLDEFVGVDPPVKNLEVSLVGDAMEVHLGGDFESHQTYSISVDKELTDKFGDSLAESTTASVVFGAEGARMAGPSTQFVIRPVSERPTLPFRMAGVESLRVRLFEADAEDWERDYCAINQRRRCSDIAVEPVHEEVQRFESEAAHEHRELSLDFAAGLQSRGPGWVTMVVDNLNPAAAPDSPGYLRYWIQYTDLFAELSYDSERVYLRVTKISDGTAVEGATLKVGSAEVATTDDQGLAQFDRPETDGDDDPVIVEAGDDALLIPYDQTGWDTSRLARWRRLAPDQESLWHVFVDRDLARPGDTLVLRGWVRQPSFPPDGRTTPATQQDELHYVAEDSAGTELRRGVVEIDDANGFELSIPIADRAASGTAFVKFGWRATSVRSNRPDHRVDFEISEQPRSHHAVHVASGESTMGEQWVWEGRGRYRAGGPISGARTSWQFTEEPTHFNPPGWKGWYFGPRYGYPRQDFLSQPAMRVIPDAWRSAVHGHTDEEGRSRVELSFEQALHGGPVEVLGEVTVADDAAGVVSDGASVLVHPSNLYVGLRRDDHQDHHEQVALHGEPLTVQIVVVDHDGRPVEDRDVTVELFKDDMGQRELVDECRVQSSTIPRRCTVVAGKRAGYDIVASVEDDEGRRSVSHLRVPVHRRDFGTTTRPGADLLDVTTEGVRFLGDQRARVRVDAPYYPLDATVEVRARGRVHSRRAVTIDEDNPTVDVEITESMAPNAFVHVHGTPAADDYRPHRFAVGTATLEVGRSQQLLDVAIGASSGEWQPGKRAEWTVDIRDGADQPVAGADVDVMVVDDFDIPAPFFPYPFAGPVERYHVAPLPGVMEFLSRSWMAVDIDERVPWEELWRRQRWTPPVSRTQAIPLGTTPGTDNNRLEAAAMSDDTGAFGIFFDDLVTDDEGRVTLAAELPKRPSRYRIIAIATDEARRFGRADTSVTVRNQLSVGVSAPRFAHVGDRLELPVFVTNQTGQEQQVDVAMRASEGLEFIDGTWRQIEISAGETAVLRFPVRALRPGAIVAQAAATGGDHRVWEDIRLQVNRPPQIVGDDGEETRGFDDEDRPLRIGPSGDPVVVVRRYEAVEDSADVQRGDDEAWHIRAGSILRVVLTVAAPDGEGIEQIVDSLPAGLEPVFGDLFGYARDTDVEWVDTVRGWPLPQEPFAQRASLARGRVEIRGLATDGRIQTISYLSRAATPGAYTAWPAAVSPAIPGGESSRSSSARLVVE